MAGSLDPLLTAGTSEPSPADLRAQELEAPAEVRQRIAQAQQQGPTVRQRSQSETIDLELARSQLGNPFSVRHIPFEVRREMTTDSMLAFGWYFTITPLIRADWAIQGPDAQLNAAVDAALRPVIVPTFLSFANSLWDGHTPLVKRFKMGKLWGTYRDPTAAKPDEDLQVWTSSADALLWRPPIALNPSHCLPTWNDNGEMDGFKFSSMPIPHFDLLGATSAYSYTTIPGKVIDSSYASWIVNEKDLHYGSIFGSPRTARAYRFWWSYWFRWALGDRSFENLLDPPKRVYYPTEFSDFVDPDDPNQVSPQVRQARNTAISLGQQARSGASLAIPGDLAETQDGKSSTHRKWEIDYLEGKAHFADLESSLASLQVEKLRAFIIPEGAFLHGSGKAAGGNSGRLMQGQLGEVYEESQQLLLSIWDGYINTDWIPQFVAANFPAKVGTPCEKSSRGIGVYDEQMRAAVLTLVGQVRGEVLPVDTRELLQQSGIPVLSHDQQLAEMKNIAELMKTSSPPVQQPTVRGMQGYNAGVMATPTAENPNLTQYYQPRERILLAQNDGFINSLPDTPHFQSAAVRSAVVRLRKTMLDRYREQYVSFSAFLGDHATLHLAQGDTQQASGLDHQQAATSAAALVAAWAATNAPGLPGHPSQAIGDATSLAADLAAIELKIALQGGADVLKKSRLHAEGFDDTAVSVWVQDRVKFALESVDQTVRDEALNWLTTQLEQTIDPEAAAKSATDFFDVNPIPHADRVALTESVAAYNHGTLLALQLAGVDQVQAHDASDGTDLHTDAECLARDGKTFSVTDAMQIQDHPRGTLFWTPLTTESLSLERVDSLPDHLQSEGMMAAYDPDRETLYVLSLATDQQERTYLKALGVQLSYR